MRPQRLKGYEGRDTTARSSNWRPSSPGRAEYRNRSGLLSARSVTSLRLPLSGHTIPKASGSNPALVEKDVLPRSTDEPMEPGWRLAMRTKCESSQWSRTPWQPYHASVRRSSVAAYAPVENPCAYYG